MEGRLQRRSQPWRQNPSKTNVGVALSYIRLYHGSVCRSRAKVGKCDMGRRVSNVWIWVARFFQALASRTAVEGGLLIDSDVMGGSGNWRIWLHWGGVSVPRARVSC